MEHENDRLLEMSNIEKLTREIDSESFNVDMLRMQFACLITNGSAGNDESLLDNVLNATRQDSFSEPANEAATVEHDSTDSFKLPSPPTDSPDKDNVCDPVSNVSTDAVDSKSSRTSLKGYVWSSANSDLPSWILDDDEERLIWPSKDKFFAETDQFEENVHYQLSVEIGSGAFGKCYLAVEVPADETTEGRIFCVKECQYRKNELLALELAKKENIAEIIDFYGVKIKGKNATIFMEFMAGGTIADVIQENKKHSNTKWPTMSETDSLGFLEDVLKAVKFLHSKGIVHRDIKGENVLLDETHLRAKLTDFGSAESFRDASPSIDIWKIACLLLEMLNGKRAPLFINEGSLQRQNSCKPEDYIPSEAMEVTRELLSLCFGLKTTDRSYLPSAVEVLKYSDAFPVTELLKRLSKLSGDQLLSSENLS